MEAEEGGARGRGRDGDAQRPPSMIASSSTATNPPAASSSQSTHVGEVDGDESGGGGFEEGKARRREGFEERDALSERWQRLAVQAQLLDHRLCLLVARNHPKQAAQVQSWEKVREQFTEWVEKCFHHAYPEGHICNIYITGSRWFGTALPGSDWDFVLVVTGIEQPSEHQSTLQFRKGKQHKAPTPLNKDVPIEPMPLPPSVGDGDDTDGIDICIYELEYFKNVVLAQHLLWALPFLSYPPEGIWKQEIDLKQIFSGIRLLTLRRSVFQVATTSLGQAATFFRKGKVRKAKKRLLYAVRYFFYAMQIVEHGGVVDTGVANELGFQLMSNPFWTWKEMNDWYEATIAEPAERFKRLTHTYRELEYSADRSKFKKIYPLQLLHYIEAYGLNTLVSCLSIEATQHPTHGHLLRLKDVRDESPIAALVVQEASAGVIIDIASAKRNARVEYNTVSDYVGKGDDISTWQVVSFGLQWFPSYDWGNKEWCVVNPKALQQAIDWNTVRVYEKLDGQEIVLYYNKGAWLITSKDSIDCSQPGRSRRTLDYLFWGTWKACKYSLPSDMSRCYIFEFLSPEFAAVAHVPEGRIVLIAVREMESLHEIDPVPIAHHHNWEMCNTVRFENAEELLQKASRINPAVLKGYVLCDSNFSRVVLNGAQYEYLLLAHKTIELHKKEERYLFLLISCEDWPLLLRHFPLDEDRELVLTIDAFLRKVVADTDAFVEKMKGLDNKQVATLEVKPRKWMADLIFMMRRGGFTSTREGLCLCRPRNTACYTITKAWKDVAYRNSQGPAESKHSAE